MDASLIRWVGENFGLVALMFAFLVVGGFGFLSWMVWRSMGQVDRLADKFQLQQSALAEVFRAEAKEERRECRERHEAAVAEIAKLTAAIAIMAAEVRAHFFHGGPSR